MDYEPVTLPTSAEIHELVPIQAVKASLRIQHNAEDALIADFIEDAFRYFDGPHGWLRQCLLPQTWDVYYDHFERRYFELPIFPNATITSVEYRTGSSGAYTALAPTEYFLSRAGYSTRVEPAYNVWWPSVPEVSRAIKVRVAGGFTGRSGANPTPRPIIRAINLLVGSLYKNREADNSDTRSQTAARSVVYGIEKLAGLYRVPPDLVDAYARR